MQRRVCGRLSHKPDSDATPSLGSGTLVEEWVEKRQEREVEENRNKTASSGHSRTHEFRAAVAARTG